MSNSELLTVEPLDLQFPFELKKQISCSLYLTNKTDNNVAFKVKTTNPKKYCFRPNTGVVLPRSTCEVLVTMQAQKEAPSDMQCKDKFLLQGVIATPGVTAKEVTPEMFSKEAGHLVEETKLRVTYVAPPRPPSPVHEGSEEGSSPRASISDNGHASEFSFQRSSMDKVEPQENTYELDPRIRNFPIEKNLAGDSIATPKWRKVAYGGMQIGYDDNYTDESFLEEMVMNANVVRRDLLKVMKDSVSISQYLCIIALVVLVWFHTLESSLEENSLLLLDLSLLASGFLILLLTEEKMLSLSLLLRYVLNISFFTTGLYVLAPIYQTLTRSISSDSIWAVTVSLLLLHLFLHDYSGSTIRAPRALENPNLTSCISLNASVVASVFVASRLPSRLHVFAMMFFSLQVFLFAPLVTYCIKKFSFGLHLLFSFALMSLTMYSIYLLHILFFFVFLLLVLFVNVVCPYWLIKMQEYKFEINGPWDEAKLCFDITD